MSATRFDFAVIGAGMAGASMAAELAAHGSVLIVEAEERPGFHATGRSAAFWMESYGGPEVLPLTRVSGPWLDQHGFLKRRGALHIAREAELGLLEAFAEQFGREGILLERLDRVGADDLVPGLRPGWTAALLERSTCDIDVAGLHSHYLSQARRHGARLACNAKLVEAEWRNGRWRLRTSDNREISCLVLVNAAGAWADDVAQLAGIRPLGIRPLRRTMAQLRMEQPVPSELPLVLGIDGSFYFKPEGGRLWLTPHDEHPCTPCDAAPEEIDIAVAIDRFEQVVDWRIAALEHKWAGLRSFAPDRLPVYGADPSMPSFFWFAGQGGFGIQTAPAAARLGAQLLLGSGPDELTRGLDAQTYATSRFVWQKHPSSYT